MDKNHNEILICLHASYTHTLSLSLSLLHSLKQFQTHLNICTTDSSYFKVKKKKRHTLLLEITIVPQRGFKIGMYYFSAVMDSQNKYIHRTISIPYTPIWWTDFMLLCNADKHFISLSLFFFLVAKHYDLPKNIQGSFHGKLHNLLTVLMFWVAQYDLLTEFKII